MSRVKALKSFTMRERRRRLGWRDYVIVLLSGIVAVMGALAYFAYTLPIPDGFAESPDRPSMLLKAENDEVFASRGEFRGEWLSDEFLPDRLRQAVPPVSYLGVTPRSVSR